MSEPITEFLRGANIEFRENFDLSSLSSIKIGGKARLIAYPSCEFELIDLLRFLKLRGLPYRIIGGASNILFCDGIISTFIISTKRMCNTKIQDSLIYSESGANLRAVCRLCMNAELGGLEALSGIPGSIGGAVAGNSGAFGAEVSDFIEFVRAYDPERDSIRRIPVSECGFSYRNSRFSYSGEVILGVELKLCHKEREEIKDRWEMFSRIRKENQPCDMPSLGCTFKKTRLGSAGELIDKCGLKGHALGGALISSKHAGFIVNKGGATAADYIALAYLCRKSVFERFHFYIEPEIKFLMR